MSWQAARTLYEGRGEVTAGWKSVASDVHEEGCDVAAHVLEPLVVHRSELAPVLMKHHRFGVVDA
jgi:hypothetical protein